MMIRLLIFLASLFLFGACTSSAPAPASRAEGIVAEIHNPSSRKVLVACHRGDWRNWPENSIPAIESVIRMGVSIFHGFVVDFSVPFLVTLFCSI